MSTHMDDLLPIGKAARIAGVSIETLRRWGRTGKLTEYRDHNQKRFFRRVELLERSTPRLHSPMGSTTNELVRSV